MIPINPEAIGDPAQTPVVYIGEGAAEVLGIPNRSAQPDPTTPLDLEAAKATLGALQRACVDVSPDKEGSGGDWLALSVEMAKFAPALLAALAEAQRERDEARYERRLLGMARRVLDLVADGEAHGYDVDYIRNQAADVAQRIVDEIGHPVTDEPALGPSFREQLAEAQRREELMRPVVDKAQVRAQVVRDLAEFGSGSPGWYERDTTSDLDLVAAVDTYETQEGTE